MSGGKRKHRNARPGEKRRRKRRRLSHDADISQRRPAAWVRKELIGVTAYIMRLERATPGLFPEAWRVGQLTHYKNRADKLRDELRELGESPDE